MPGGRPRTSSGRDEFRGLAEHLNRARALAGLSIADVLRRTGIAEKAGYEFFRAQRLPSQLQADALAKVLGDGVLKSWRVAKAAIERAELAQRERVVVRSWDELPKPDPVLTEVLEAQLAVADRFPYALLGVDAPTVSSLYVPEQLRRENLTGAATALTTLSAALAEHRNILITAEAGGGKSMAARRMVHRVAARWLRHNGTDIPLPEPVAAVYLSAVDIAPGRPLAESVADALARSGRFRVRPTASRFAERAQGTRWLVVVDELDDVTDRETRRKMLELLDDHMRGGGPYRFVLMSRPLPEDELRLLDPALPRFALRRFNTERLRQFSERWFATKDVPQGTADRFVAAVVEAGLGEVVAVPLFATIAAAIAGRGSPDDLPRSRLDLYERFVDELLEARTPDDTLSPYAHWLRSQRVPLLEHLAQTHVANGVVHLVAAERWVDRMCPAELSRPRAAAAEIRHSLIETGVVTVDGTVVRFPHRSVAEYLTARARAALIPAHFPDLKAYLKEDTQGRERNLTVLTIAAWTRLPGHDPALVFRHLLGKRDYLPMAVDLITTGVTPGPMIEKAVTTSVLLECRDDSYPSERYHEALVRLGPRHVSRHLFAEMLLNTTREPRRLALAAKTYGVMFDRDEAVRILTDLSRSTDPQVLVDVAEQFDALGMSSASAEIYRRVTEADAATPSARAMAAYRLATAGHRNLDAAAWRAFDEADYHRNACELAAAVLVAEHGRAVIPQIRGRLLEKGMSTWMWSEIALLFAEAGADDDAIDLAAAVLDTRCDLMDDGNKAAEAMAIALRSREPDEIVATVLRRAAQVPDYLAAVATELAAQGADHAAVRLAQECISRGTVDSWELRNAVEVVLTAASPQDSPDVVELLFHQGLTTRDRLRLIRDSVFPFTVDTVRAVCEPVLADPGAATDYLATAAAIWLDRTNGQDAAALAELLRKRILPPKFLVSVLRRFARNDSLADAFGLVETLLRDMTTEVESIADGLRLCADHLPDEALDQLVPLVSGGLRGSERIHIATVLLGVGRPDLGLALWRAALVDPSTAIADRIEAADHLAGLGFTDSAVATLVETSQGEVTEAEAKTLCRLVAWIKA